MCSSWFQLASGSRDLSQENNCYVKFKMTTLFIQDIFECHFVNLLSFTQLLFSSQLEVHHVIQEPNEAN